MAQHEQMMLVCLETGKPLRICTADDWSTYMALVDALTPAAKQYGVVDGTLFGHTGPVYVQEVGGAGRVRVSVTLSPHARKRLDAFAHALDMTPSKVIEFLLEQQPLPQELNQVPERLTHL